MTLYAESSAILSWLLGEAAGRRVRDHLAAAESIVTSVVTFVECERALIRAQHAEKSSAALFADRRVRLKTAAAHWHRMPVSDDVLERAKQPFPIEPVRTLDALHLASALTVKSALAGLVVLSLDRRVRDTAVSLGFEVVPEEGHHDLPT